MLHQKYWPICSLLRNAWPQSYNSSKQHSIKWTCSKSEALKILCSNKIGSTSSWMRCFSFLHIILVHSSRKGFKHPHMAQKISNKRKTECLWFLPCSQRRPATGFLMLWGWGWDQDKDSSLQHKIWTLHNLRSIATIESNRYSLTVDFFFQQWQCLLVIWELIYCISKKNSRKLLLAVKQMTGMHLFA